MSAMRTKQKSAPVKGSTALLTFDSFFNQFPAKIFKKRATILNSGVVSANVYYLAKGYARTYAISSKGEDLTMVIFQPGDFFPLISTIRPKPLEYYIEALTEVEIIQVPRLEFIEFLRSREDLLVDFALHLTARFEGVLTRMEHLVFGSAAQRLISIIIILGERFGQKRGSFIFVQSPLTHRDLASLVGITRETTTLILRELTKKGYVSFERRHLIIKNLRGLRSEVLVL